MNVKQRERSEVKNTIEEKDKIILKLQEELDGGRETLLNGQQIVDSSKIRIQNLENEKAAAEVSKRKHEMMNQARAVERIPGKFALVKTIEEAPNQDSKAMVSSTYFKNSVVKAHDKVISKKQEEVSSGVYMEICWRPFW